MQSATPVRKERLASFARPTATRTPELPEVSNLDDAEVVESEEHARGDERDPDDEPGHGVGTGAGVRGSLEL
jgi:hypothetical protein